MTDTRENIHVVELRSQIDILYKDLTNPSLRNLTPEDLKKRLELDGYDEDIRSLYAHVENEWQRRLTDDRDTNSSMDGDRSQQEHVIVKMALLEVLPLARTLNDAKALLAQLRKQTPASEIGSVEGTVTALSDARWIEALHLLAETPGTPEDLERAVQQQRHGTAERLLRDSRALPTTKQHHYTHMASLESVQRIGVESQREEARRLMKQPRSRYWLVAVGVFVTLLLLGLCSWAILALGSGLRQTNPPASPDPAAVNSQVPEPSIPRQTSDTMVAPTPLTRVESVTSTGSASNVVVTATERATLEIATVQPSPAPELDVTPTVVLQTETPVGPPPVVVQGVRAAYAYTNRVVPDAFGAFTRLRTEPRVNSSSIAYLRNGDQVQIVENSKNWYRIRITQNGDGSQVGQTGWIEQWLVDDRDVPPAPVLGIVIPDVHGADVGQARAFLEGKGFRVVVSQLASDQVGSLCNGWVSYSNPAKGVRVPRGTQVRLFYRGFDLPNPPGCR